MNETNKTISEAIYIFDDVPRISKLLSVSCCLAMSVLYVASLYIWCNKNNRDHPATIARRFLSVTVVMLLTPTFVYKFSSNELLEKVAFNDLLGLRWPGLLMAITVPYLLTIMLFLGPLCVEILNDMPKIFIRMEFWARSPRNILWVRNYVMAPLSEEFVFRACMMPLILQSFTPLAAIFITPLFFGVAHIHHIVERLSIGIPFFYALLISLLQFAYTTLFGFYSAYLFARTGHFIAPFLVHSLCNHMGLPNLHDLWHQILWKRLISITCYFIGFIAFVILVPVATDPKLYKNNIFWP